uniref:Uncharacterized protein n=1 Tax=Rhizophora mucronata TaxID=61149 RepID=A0A2P2PFK3_RHIMU
MGFPRNCSGQRGCCRANWHEKVWIHGIRDT